MKKHNTSRVFTIHPVDFVPSTTFQHEEDDCLPTTKRGCRDVLFIFIFITFFSILAYIILDVIIVKKSDPNLLIHGYDIYGNICGQNNTPILNLIESGQDMTEKPYLLVEKRNNRIFRSCVEECPVEKDHVAIFYRCIPKNFRLPFVIDAYNITRNLVDDIISDISICWKEIAYLCSISFVFSLLLLVFFRYLAGVVIWITLFALSLASISGTAYIWLIWNYYKVQLDHFSPGSPQRNVQEKLVDQWFVGGLSASIFTFIFLLIVVVMRKRIQIVARLFKEAGKAISDMPFILLQPIWTFAILILISFVWLYSLLHLQSNRIPYIDQTTNFVFYYLEPFYKYMKWYHIFAYLWIIHFVVSCQHFVIAGAVSLWFFKRKKADLESPILQTIGFLIRYHLGSIAFGSLLVASVKMVRILFKRMETLIQRYQKSCDGCSTCCKWFLWCFEKFIIYINRNAFIQIAIHGDSFCVAARRAFTALSNNALRAIAINSVGDFLLFIGKICVVIATVFIGIELLKDKFPLLNHDWAPLLVVAIFAYSVAHCFLSVYEMTIDTLFMCFVEDCQKNDGSQRPYYMSSDLMQFMQETNRFNH